MTTYIWHPVKNNFMFGGNAGLFQLLVGQCLRKLCQVVDRMFMIELGFLKFSSYESRYDDDEVCHT